MSLADAMCSEVADALRYLREASSRATRMIASGNSDPRLPALAALVVVQGPLCPRCRCSIAGISPSTCPGCGALVSWVIDTRIVR